MFGRLLWKELRTQLPFWITVVFTMLLCGVIVVWTGRGESWSDNALITLGAVFSLLYPVGCGAMAYANEKEEGTWELLRRLAIPSTAVCAAKLITGLLGVLSVVGIALAELAWQLPGWFQVSAVEKALFATTAVLATSLLLLLSQVASQVAKNVLWALAISTFAGVPTVMMFTSSVMMYSTFIRRPEDAGRLETLALTYFFSLLSMIVLILCQFGLAHRWLKYRERNPMDWIWLWDNPLTHSQGGEAAWRIRPVWCEQLGRLAARELLLARPWLWITVLTLAIPVVAQGGAGVVLIGPLLISGVLFGVWAYQPDQHDQLLRFLADRGVSPRLVWLSKHLVRIPILLVVVFAALVMALLSSPGWYGMQGVHIAERLAVSGVMALGFSFLSYACGQLLGQLIRSPIVASFLGVVLTGLVTAWVGVASHLFG